MQKPKLFIPLITLGLGFIPLSISSLLIRAFWLDSNYDFPLMSNPSVFLGDLLILPLLNIQIYYSIRLIEIDKKKNSFIILYSLLLSLVLNIYSHFMWTQDSYTGFMDIELGRLSIAGYWHLLFSVFQSFLIFYFVFIWIKLFSKMNGGQFNHFLNTWYLFIGFTSLSAPGFLIKLLTVYKEKSLLESIRLEITSFVPMLISIIFFLVMKRLKP